MPDEDRDPSKIRLSRRKLLGSAALVGGASALGTAGTGALFWDEEKFGNAGDPNFFQAGSLDLKVDWEVRYYDWLDDTAPDEDNQGTRGSIDATSADFPGATADGLVDQPGPLVKLTDLKPGDVIEKTLSLHVFDNPGFVSMAGDITRDDDNGITEPEDKVNGHVADDSDGDPFLAGLLGAGMLGGPSISRLKSRLGLGDDEDEPLLGPKARKAAYAGAAGAAGLAATSGTAAALDSGASVTDIGTSGATATDLVNTLLGPDSAVSIVNTPTYTGSDLAAGTFTGGGPPVGIDEGLILGSGDVNDILGPNSSDGTSSSLGTAGDGDLTTLANQGTNDAAVLEFDFTVPEGEDQVYFNYVFGSEEYNEWIDQYNDVFGFFVNGTNVATVNGDPVSINTINAAPDDHPDLYNNNDPSDLGTPTPYDTEMDGFTDVLTIQADVNPGETNTMKLAIADAGDSALDSWVLLEGGTLDVNPPTPTEDGTGELDNVMQCVVWYDGNDAADPNAGDNFPAEILPPDTGYEPGGMDFVMDLTEGAIDFVNNENLLFEGSLRKMFNALDDGQLLSPGGETPAEYPGTLCFENSTTHYIGMLCWVPRDIPDYIDNVIQTDTVEYYFGFDAIQCRHNVADDGGPIDGTLPDADAEHDQLLTGNGGP